MLSTHIIWSLTKLQLMYKVAIHITRPFLNESNDDVVDNIGSDISNGKGDS